MWVPPKTFQCFLLVQSDDIFPSNSAQMLQSFRTLNRSSGRSPHRWPHFKTTPLRQRTFWMLPFQKPGIFSLRPSHIGTVFFEKLKSKALVIVGVLKEGQPWGNFEICQIKKVNQKSTSLLRDPKSEAPLLNGTYKSFSTMTFSTREKSRSVFRSGPAFLKCRSTL